VVNQIFSNYYYWVLLVEAIPTMRLFVLRLVASWLKYRQNCVPCWWNIQIITSKIAYYWKWQVTVVKIKGAPAQWATHWANHLKTDNKILLHCYLFGHPSANKNMWNLRIQCSNRSYLPQVWLFPTYPGLNWEKRARWPRTFHTQLWEIRRTSAEWR